MRGEATYEEREGREESGRLEQGRREGAVARTIENQTAKLPSDVWLWSALGSMGASLFLHMTGRKKDGLFVGQWAAPFLLFGVYNKLVKINGSDRARTDQRNSQ